MQSRRETFCERGFFRRGSWVLLRRAVDVPPQGRGAGVESGGIVFVFACEGTAETLAGAVGRRFRRRPEYGFREAFSFPRKLFCLNFRVKLQVSGCYRWCGQLCAAWFCAAVRWRG